MHKLIGWWLGVIFIMTNIIFTSCDSSPETLFVLLPFDKTGIDFSNTISESDSFNIFTYDYIYNGGGVAVSDFNNDGLQDIFFTGNMVPNKLYLNKGELKFEDVTTKANVNIEGRWNSGVVVVDINNDGWQDIYVCATMKEDSLLRANMLFLNMGVDKNNVPVFEEVAKQYGIADTGYSLMAAFFDYDMDGDLDLYVLTNKQSGETSSNYRPKVVNGSSPTTDRLYRNNGNGTFDNVSQAAGIVYEGFGLGLAISDFNGDGWPDVYASNDFITNDILYLNNQDGTFTNQSAKWIGHQSQFSMGNDAADFNNDGLVDLITMDMLPESNQRRKTTINNKNYLNYINNETFEYEYQYVRNMLQYNNSLGDEVNFSEIGQMAGVFQTEWSWSALFVDFDNDGFRDLFITNGFPKDITDKDFVNFRSDLGAYMSNSMLADSVPVVRIPNYAYKNNGDLTFTDVSKKWGFSQPSFSNGAAFADFDNDGDLDFVVNNINQEAFLYKNRLNDSPQGHDTHFLRIRLLGLERNKQAIGSKVSVYYDSGKFQYHDHSVARGYLSSVESTIHIGLGKTITVDSIIVEWKKGLFQKIEGIKADQLIEIKFKEASLIKREAQRDIQKSGFLMKEVTEALRFNYKHEEVDRIDYNLQRTLPHKFSQFGPGVCVGDVNGDNLDDIIIGGSSNFSTSLFKQNHDGLFSNSIELPKYQKAEEDEGMLLFDADGDLDLDLYLVSGSLESDPKSEIKNYQDRILFNDGRGNFVYDSTSLPTISSSGSCVRAADIDQDGDLDLFVGGRVVPGSYPYPAESYLLINEKGKFINQTNKICKELVDMGMITDAIFSDFNNDGLIDLIVVGEFLPVTFLINKGGQFEKLNISGLNKQIGWWNSIVAGDFDHDNDIDYIVGNLGMNNGYQVSEEHPLVVYAKDFDKNESIDAIVACYLKESLTNNKKKLFPVHFWDEINAQSPRFRKQFSQYKQYGLCTMDELFSKEDLEGALILSANYFKSSYIKNIGDGKFEMVALPTLAQISPVNGMVVDDVNGDGNLDVIMVGNDFGNEVFSGRLDASTGLILLGDGQGNFIVKPSKESGFLMPGDTKGMAKFFGPKNEELYLVTRNRDTGKIFRKEFLNDGELLLLKPQDSWAEFIFDDDKRSRMEFYYGSGYLSQSSRKVMIPTNVKEIVIHSFDGKKRTIVPKKFP